MLLNPSPPDSCQEINGHMTLMHTGAGHIPLCGIFLNDVIINVLGTVDKLACPSYFGDMEELWVCPRADRADEGGTTGPVF